MSSYRPNVVNGMNASPIPILRRRRDSMFSESEKEVEESSDYYRQSQPRPTQSHRHQEGRGHHGHHHGSSSRERDDPLPQQLRQSPSPAERGPTTCGCQDCQPTHQVPRHSHHSPANRSDGHVAHHHCHQQREHDSPSPRHSSCACEECSPPVHQSRHHVHHCNACQHAQPVPSNSYAHHASARLPPRQVTFQSLPPPRKPLIRQSMNVLPPGGHSTFLGLMPPQLHHQTHAALLPAADYTTMNNMSGMNVQTMPFASPHVGSRNGAGYPNAMPLSRSVEMLPGPGQYGAPKYATFAKPG